MSWLPPLGPRGEGWFAAQMLVTAAVVAALGTGPSWRGPARIVTSVAGVALMAAGTALGVAGARALGSSASVLPRPKASGELVDSGAYALVRHPIYAGQLLGAAGLALVAASRRALLVVAVLAAVLTLKSAREEAFLAERYPGYAAYARRTRRLLPGIW